nr:ACT domain-containing protein [Egibacter rhizosphaerae]
MMRCAVPDKPGSLAHLAGVISDAGGDIQAVEVVEHVVDADGSGRAIDDLVVVIDGEAGANLLDRVRDLPDIELVHAGPSRGHPGDAVTRIAVALEALLTGQTEPDRGGATLLGGQLRAHEARVVSRSQAPEPHGRRLVFDWGRDVLVVERDYRFADAERERADALVRLCQLVAGPGDAAVTPATSPPDHG